VGDSIDVDAQTLSTGFQFRRAVFDEAYKLLGSDPSHPAEHDCWLRIVVLHETDILVEAIFGSTSYFLYANFAHIVFPKVGEALADSGNASSSTPSVEGAEGEPTQEADGDHPDGFRVTMPDIGQLGASSSSRRSRRRSAAGADASRRRSSIRKPRRRRTRRARAMP